MTLAMWLVRSFADLLRISVVALAAILLASEFSFANTPDDPLTDEQRMVAGLRVRLLFDLADRYCDERLAKRDRTAVAQSNLLIEKIQTQMARSVQTDPKSRSAAWQECRRIGDGFLALNPDHPRRLLIRVQQALALLAEARLTSQALAVAGADASSRADALDRLRAARAEFESILRDLVKELPLAPEKRDESGRLTSLQLQGLQSNLQFQIGLCHLMRAELVDSSKLADRLDALSTAGKNFEAVLNMSDPEGSLWSMAQMRMAEVHRLNQDQTSARRLLDSLELDQLPPAQQCDYWEQQLEIADSENAVLAALSKVAALANRTPQLELASMRAVLRIASSTAPNERDNWLNRAALLAEEIETRHGAYWGRLAELTLVKSSGAEIAGNTPDTTMTPETSNVPAQFGAIEILIRTGDNAARDGRVDDALQAYRKAIQLGQGQAATDQSWKTVLQTYLKVSRILEAKQAFREAAEELLQGVGGQPRHELACWLHLQAIWCLAQSFGQETRLDSELKTRYRRLLDEHLGEYAGAPTLPFALLWKARLEAREANYRLATELYLRVDITSDSGTAAMAELLPAIEKYLESLGAQTDRITSEAASLAQAMKAHLSAVTGQQFVAKSPATRSLLTALATLGLRWGVIDREDLTLWLTNSLQACEPNDPWRVSALSLLAACFALDPSQHGRAIEWIHQLETAESLEQCLAILTAAAQRDRSGDPIRLALLDRLLALESSDRSRSIEWRLLQASLWQQLGQLPNAIAALGTLAAEQPKRLDVQLQYARALSLDSENGNKALTQWRRVAVGVKERSDEWFEAKYQVARLLLETGQAAEARKLLDYLTAFPPGWSQSKLKWEFDELVKRARESDPP